MPGFFMFKVGREARQVFQGVFCELYFANLDVYFVNKKTVLVIMCEKCKIYHKDMKCICY